MSITILVIDDSPDAIRMAHKHLSELGEVIAATSGQTGVQLAFDSRPEIILLDLQMPEVDGFDVLATLKSTPSTQQIPVILVTADNSPAIESQCLERGAADFIAKPVNPTVLKARVNKELQLARQRQLIEQSHQLLEREVMLRTAELTVAKEAAEVASKAKSNFLGNMSHEMRTPLHQVSGFLSLLLRRAEDPKSAHYLERIQEALGRLSSLIEGILEAVSIESKTVTVNYAPLNLAETVGEVVNGGFASLKERNTISLTRTIDEKLPTELYGDKRLLTMALNCYVQNALKYTEQGSVNVRVDILQDCPESLTIKCAVSDTGPGIKAEMIPRLFEIFEQDDNSSTRRFGGTGLGLHLVRKLAHEMAGDAGCESELGLGSTFWFTARLYKYAPAATSSGESVSIMQTKTL